jgi:D-arabinose 1-dehydrogenase-like Zn-dependent alcohol dehydrogenase
MTMKAFGYATHSATSPLVPFGFERRDPRPDDVVIEILYCGVCHSDLHQGNYPPPIFGHGFCGFRPGCRGLSERGLRP